MAVDIIKLAPESFQTIYLRKEDRIVLRTEQGRKIIIRRIIIMINLINIIHDYYYYYY